MQIRLRLFATYREIVGSRGLMWSARDGITLRELVDGIVAKYPRLADHRSSMCLALHVAIACAGSHRAETFAACEWVMDEVKRIVPIWKTDVEGRPNSVRSSR